jgi:hypothetical protein
MVDDMAKWRSTRTHLFPSSSLVPGLAAVAAICAASPAVADPVLITGGNAYSAAVWTGYDPPFGFQLTGDRTSLGGITFTLADIGFYNVGDVIDLSSTFSVSSDPYRTGPFEQTVEGVAYTEVFLSGTLRFTAAPVTLTSPDAAAVEAPFTMDGSISLFRPDPVNSFQRGESFLTFAIAGSGTASLGLSPLGGTLAGTFVNYGFTAPPADPTPEPATLLLVGSGLVTTIARTRRTRSPTPRK